MHITLSPWAIDADLSVIKSGDALTINGEVFDFTALPEGAILPTAAIASSWIFGPVRRINGKVHLTLRLPHSDIPSPEQANPAPLIDPPDGPLVLPANPVFEEVENDAD